MAKNDDKRSTTDGVVVPTVGALDSNWANRRYDPEGLWAYQFVMKPVIQESNRHPIDSLIEAKTPAGVQLAPRASRPMLLRRASFDLIGLPPTPEEIDSFVNDAAKDRDAFIKVIERLLDSPHYGEHWARHWLDAKGSPILDLQPPSGITMGHQRANLDFLSQLNKTHQEKNAWHDELMARMDSYELAFRMQTQVPELVDINHEDAVTQAMYGLGSGPADAFGRKCLFARKLIERGVRFVQLYAGSWDSHDYIERAHGNLVHQVDQPIAALISDLKQRGLLESTLVVWCGEFGRSPDNGVRGGTAYGRDHNAKAMSIWFAGGGVNAGHTIGATDETGAEAVEGVVPVRDVHVTILKLLGLEDHKLTYYHAGRFKQLSQFGGQVIKKIIA